MHATPVFYYIPSYTNNLLDTTRYDFDQSKPLETHDIVA